MEATMLLNLPLPDPEETARSERQALWRAQSVAGLKKDRERRMKELVSLKSAISEAVNAYEQIDKGSVPHISLRTRFIRLNQERPIPSAETGDDSTTTTNAQKLLKADRESRPPLTKLIARKTNSLQLYLSAIYVAHLEVSPGKKFQNDKHLNAFSADGVASWATLAGLRSPSTPRARRLRVTRALKELSSIGLVDAGPHGARDRFKSFRLCMEDGSNRTYAPPSPVSKVVKLPPSFFLRGWHLALQPKEIATFLAILEMTKGLSSKRHETGIALPETVRQKRYGLSGEAYESIHELEEFGLIEIHDPMPNRRRGKVRTATEDERSAAERAEKSFEPSPYRFIPKDLDMVFDRDARETVLKCLKESNIPPRLSDSLI
jgi:hypothetical protein